MMRGMEEIHAKYRRKKYIMMKKLGLKKELEPFNTHNTKHGFYVCMRV